MYCTVSGMGLNGITAYRTSIEVSETGFFGEFRVNGMSEIFARDTEKRILSALENNGITSPSGGVAVNIVPKANFGQSSLYDLPIIIGMLKVKGMIDADISTCAFIGEVSPEGKLVHVCGILPMVLEAKAAGIKKIFIPKENAPEGAVAGDVRVYAVENICDVIDNLNGLKQLKALSYGRVKYANEDESQPDFSDVTGQFEAKRALEIAAAGFHNIILIGPPGAGKSMLAKRIPSILPEMTYEESLEVTKIHSVCGTLPKEISVIDKRPFVAPSHRVSAQQLLGTAEAGRPGDLSLANDGVLFLDELPEYSRVTMEQIGDPLEKGMVTLSKDIVYPCSLILVAAMNPCPCGFYGHPTRKCSCSESSIKKYLAKASGPIFDSIDLHVEVMPVEFIGINKDEVSESSSEIRKRVNEARKIQIKRYKGTGIKANSEIPSEMIGKYCILTDDARKLLKDSFQIMGISERAHDSVLKVSRTIADLDGSAEITKKHVAEALQYRSLDRKYWGN